MPTAIERKPSTFCTFNSEGQATLWESLGTDREGRGMIKTSVSGSRGKVYDAERTLGQNDRSWVSGRRAAESEARNKERAGAAFAWPRPINTEAWSITGDTGVDRPSGYLPPSVPNQQVRFSELPSTTCGTRTVGDSRTTRRAPKDFPPATQNTDRAPPSQVPARDQRQGLSTKPSNPPPPPSSPVSTTSKRPELRRYDDGEMGSLAERVRSIPIPRLSTRGKGPSTSNSSDANMIPSMIQTRPSVNPQKMFGDPNVPTPVRDRSSESLQQGFSHQSGRTERDYGGHVGAQDHRSRPAGETGGSESLPARTGFNNLPTTLSRPYLATGPVGSDKSSYPPARRLAYRTAQSGADAASSSSETQGSSGGRSFVDGRPISGRGSDTSRYPRLDKADASEGENEDEEEEGDESESVSESESDE